MQPQPYRHPIWIRVLTVLCATGFLIGLPALSLAQEESPKQPDLLIGSQAEAFQGGYVLPTEQVSGTVIGAREVKKLYAYGDILYVRFRPGSEMKVGERVTLYRKTDEVYHPVIGQYIGRVIATLGVLEISTPPVNRVSEARVIQSFDSLSPGDPIMPYKPPPAVPDQSTSGGTVRGMIVAFKVPRQVTAQGEIVYIDRGSGDGVSLGDRFTVIRQGTWESMTTRFPDYAFGELKVIGLQERTATAFVMKSTDALQRGDTVMQLASVAKAVPEEAVKPAQGEIEPGKAPEPQIELADIHFEFDKWTLTKKAKEELLGNVAFLKLHPTARIIIEGHADERGSREYNIVLGEKRAEEVRRHLADMGFSNPATVISYGKDRPLCTEREEACYEKNRRTHLVTPSE
jgi:peptidoglycan-associated lipoprotein